MCWECWSGTPCGSRIRRPCPALRGRESRRPSPPAALPEGCIPSAADRTGLLRKRFAAPCGRGFATAPMEALLTDCGGERSAPLFPPFPLLFRFCVAGLGPLAAAAAAGRILAAPVGTAALRRAADAPGPVSFRFYDVAHRSGHHQKERCRNQQIRHTNNSFSEFFLSLRPRSGCTPLAGAGWLWRSGSARWQPSPQQRRGREQSPRQARRL